MAQITARAQAYRQRTVADISAIEPGVAQQPEPDFAAPVKNATPQREVDGAACV